jgi:hypothetical protein
MVNRKISVDSVVAKMINETSPAHGLVFTWMIAHLDRDGRMTGDPLAIKGLVAPMVTAVTTATVAETLDKAGCLGLIEIYEDDRGQRYVRYPRFEANQVGLRYGREPASDFPDPEGCRKVSGSMPEHFRNTSGTLPAEGKGIEGNRREGKGRENNNVEPESLRASGRVVSPTMINDIWLWYKRWHPKAASKIGDKNARLCRARLKEGFSPDDLKKAITGYHKSPFHRGENDRGQRYQSFELIMRDQGHVQRGIEMDDDPDLGNGMTEKTRRGVNALKKWAEEKMHG